MKEWTEEESKKLVEYMMLSDEDTLHGKLNNARFLLISDGFPPRKLHELQSKITEIIKNNKL